MDIEKIIKTQYEREFDSIYKDRAGESYEETLGRNMIKSLLKGIAAYTVTPIIIYSGLSCFTDISEKEKTFYSNMGNILGVFFAIRYLRNGIRTSRNHIIEVMGDDLKKLKKKYYPDELNS
jgi:hypothetical protein